MSRVLTPHVHHIRDFWTNTLADAQEENGTGGGIQTASLSRTDHRESETEIDAQHLHNRNNNPDC